MLSCDRFAKCRTTCGSESSGREGGAAASAPAGNNSLAGRSCTSHAGNRCARRPRSLSSNNSFVSRTFLTNQCPPLFRMILPQLDVVGELLFRHGVESHDTLPGNTHQHIFVPS